MKKYIIFTLFTLLTIGKVHADMVPKYDTDANIFGHAVYSKNGEHLAYVSIRLKGTTIGTTTDATGHYMLKDLPEGKYILEARLFGYKTAEKEVVIQKGKTLEINFELDEESISLDEVVISSNRNETSRKLAPTLVSVLDISTFDKTNSSTISSGLNFQPGLRVENNCQNCGFTQVRMNGLGGAYSQILIDSRPIFSSLAGVYGLDQVPASMIDRVEVVRGGGSALFGASAIAGTINIITREPLRNSAQLSHDITSIGGKSVFDNNTNFNLSLISDNQKLGIMAFGKKQNRSAYDHDGDGFSEIPHLTNHTLGFRSFLRTSAYSKITVEYHSMHEFRRGGDNLKEEPFKTYITEQIDSNIDGGSISYNWASMDNKHRFNIYSAAQLTDRKSYYGSGEPVDKLTGEETAEEIENYNIRMNSYGKTKDITFNAGAMYAHSFDHLLFMPSVLTGGLEYTYNKLDDQSGYRENALKEKVYVGSAYVQNEWKNDQWGFLIGGRLDKHKLLDHAVFSPRANIRYNPTGDITMRLSYGQGFRAPQLFDEDLHVDLAGGEVITQFRSPNLKEEKSHSFSGSVDYYVFWGRNLLNFMVEGFYTKLNNPFTTVSTYTEDGGRIKEIVNASGAKVYGLTLEARASTTANIEVQLGATIQKSLYDDARKWSDDPKDDVKATKNMMRTPNVYGYMVATWTPSKRFNTSFSGTYTGSMYVPHEEGVIEKRRTDKSSSFFSLNYKAAYVFPLYKSISFEVNGGVQNIFNAYQNDFDKGKDRDANYIYGPATPRCFFLGAKISI